MREAELACACALPCLVPATLAFFGGNAACAADAAGSVFARERDAPLFAAKPQAPISGSLGQVTAKIAKKCHGIGHLPGDSAKQRRTNEWCVSPRGKA